jgi:regulator of protease activity HflC (stomatin/prohibitin superfamily)
VDAQTIISIIAGILGAIGIGGGKASIRFVQEGNRAIITRFGKARRVKKGPEAGQYKVLHPGWNWIIPGIDKANNTHVRQRTINCGNQQVTLKDKTVFTVDAVLVWRVGDTPENLYRALFEVTNLEQAVRFYCIGILREVIQSMDYSELIGSDAEQIGEQLKEKVKNRLASWGLVVESFKLGDLSPYGDTLRLIQIEAGAKFRAQSLKAAAQELGYDGVDKIPPALAAALVGMPVSVAVSSLPEQPTQQ